MPFGTLIDAVFKSTKKPLITAYSTFPSFSKKNVGLRPGSNLNSGILYLAPIK